MLRRQRSDGTDCIVEWWAGWERVKGVRVKGKQAARRAICATGKWVLFPKNYFLGEVSRRDAPRLARHVNGGCGDMRVHILRPVGTAVLHHLQMSLRDIFTFGGGSIPTPNELGAYFQKSLRDF